MNKYIKLFSLILASGCVLDSCDVMDTKPLESYTEDVVWSSEQTADAFVYNVYANIFNPDNRMYSSLVWNEGYTPNGCNYNGFSADTYAQDALTNSYDAGINKFSLLRKCNMIIEKSAASSVFTEAQKAKYNAEGRLLRGLVYYSQARTIGRFVPINKVLSENDAEAFKTPLTATVAESYKYVIEDLEAGTNLPETSESGRMNKYVAYAYLSEACLQAYAYTKDASYLTKAINAADQVINSGKYTLADATRYYNMFQDAGKNDAEIIFAMYRNESNTTVVSAREMINCFPNVGAGNLKVTPWNSKEQIQVCFPSLKDANGQSFISWEFHSPSHDLSDAFMVIDAQDGKAKPWNETSQFLNATENDMSNISRGCYTYNAANQSDSENRKSEACRSNFTVPDIEDLAIDVIDQAYRLKDGYTGGKNISELIYENRDKRFYATLVYDSCTWMNELVTYHCNGNLWNATGRSGSHYSISNYHYRKHVYHTASTSFYSNMTNWHVVLMRLGRVYLNKAEALLYQKKYPEAVAMLNMTRTKHGELPECTAVSETEVWKEYKMERRADLAFENDYYFSLLRWGMVGGAANSGKAAGEVITELTTPVHGIQIDVPRHRLFIYKLTRYDQYKRNFSKKRYLLPIPQSFINTRAASGITDTQNTGW